MSGYVEIVNWGATRRHYATQAWVESLQYAADYLGLCHTAYGRTIERDRMLRKRARLPERDYAALPLCKLCEKKATP